LQVLQYFNVHTLLYVLVVPIIQINF